MKTNVSGVPEENISQYWSLYNQGLSLYKDKKLDEGLEKFNRCFEDIKNKKNADAEEFRVAGLCLKKIGWYYREKKDYHKAYSYHNMRLALVREFGSSNEVHDALISLDVDVYMLKDMHLSERYLKESIQYAENIQDLQSKYMALGTTYNNLAGTLYGLNKFEEAVLSAEKSLKFWEQYEETAGQSEMKVAWAYYAIGDVYEAWAKYLKDQKQDYSIQKKEAYKNFIESQNIAAKRNMPKDSKKWIDERVKLTLELSDKI